MDTILEVTFVNKAFAGVQVVRMEGGFIDKHQHDHTHELAAEKVERLLSGQLYYRQKMEILEAKALKGSAGTGVRRVGSLGT